MPELPPPADPSKSYTAVFDTTEGEIRVVLDRERTPETVNNFVVLTRYGYYDETLLFRFDPSIAIIQGGAPKTNDWSDPGPGYTIPDEGGQFLPTSNGGLIGPFTYQPGDLVMARSAGPNSSGAQFFFATGPEVGLLDAQGTYIVFGHADLAGQAVLEALMGHGGGAMGLGGGGNRDVSRRARRFLVLAGSVTWRTIIRARRRRIPVGVIRGRDSDRCLLERLERGGDDVGVATPRRGERGGPAGVVLAGERRGEARRGGVFF